MRISAAAAILSLLNGCTDLAESMPMPAKGANYYTAREELIAAGWQPSQAKCSERNICFGDAPELATNLDTLSTCGLFVKGASSIRVCGRVIPDGILVESAQCRSPVVEDNRDVSAGQAATKGDRGADGRSFTTDAARLDDGDDGACRSGMQSRLSRCDSRATELAIYVATRYASGQMDFDEADKIMNVAWSICVSKEFWEEYDRIVPEVTYEVYEAFDAGEYYHSGDGPDVDPEVKYTKPMIAAFLASRNNDA
ncbi:MAG: hypothetical protein ACOY82_14400 [Pseudomonadota bacterium]